MTSATTELKPPGLWGTILTTTPVVLTVLATILVGLSNSEMTQAQYHRSLAAQYQSKAGDQWAFYQAKRIRGSAQETAADHLPPALPTDPERLKVAAHRLALAMEQAAKATGNTDDATKRIAQQAKNSEDALAQELDKPEVAQAFGYLTSAKVPKVEENSVNDPVLDQAIAAIRDRKSDGEINALVTQVPDKQLASSLEAAQTNAQRFDTTAKPIETVVARLAELVNRHAALAELLPGDIADASSSSEDRATKDRAQAAAEARVSRAAQKLHEGFAAARARFNANRLRREADYNQKIAFLHEIQVHKSGVNSDRHRERSLHFFFGMLGAQAGVAISSMALAARNKSVLWTLAGILGLAALAFSGYVYLYY